MHEIGAYTGELIGVEYLFSQTGEVLENKCDDDDVADPSSEPLCDMDDGQQLDERFVDDSDEQMVDLSLMFSHSKMVQYGNLKTRGKLLFTHYLNHVLSYRQWI